MVPAAAYRSAPFKSWEEEDESWNYRCHWLRWFGINPFLYTHKEVEKVELFTSSEEGALFSSKFPHLVDLYNQPLQKIDYDVLSQFDVVFASTPSGVSSNLFPPLLDRGPKLIDLSGDFRLKNLAGYEKWYKRHRPHKK